MDCMELMKPIWDKLSEETIIRYWRKCDILGNKTQRWILDYNLGKKATTSAGAADKDMVDLVDLMHRVNLHPDPNELGELLVEEDVLESLRDAQVVITMNGLGGPLGLE